MMRELTFFSSACGSHAKFTDFVLEQVVQGLQPLQAQLGKQAADVVVALDRHRLLALCATAFDHVGVDGPSGQPLCAACARLRELGGFLPEDGDELGTDDLALGFGVGDTGQLAQEQVAGVDADDLGLQLGRRRRGNPSRRSDPGSTLRHPPARHGTLGSCRSFAAGMASRTS